MSSKNIIKSREVGRERGTGEAAVDAATYY